MMDASSWNKKGCAYFAEQKWGDAADAFQHAIDLRADYLDAYYNLGLAQNKLNRSEQAMVTWLALLELSPSHVGANFQVACLLMRQGKFKEALDKFAVIQRIDPAHVETQANMATCCLQLGWLNEAKRHYANVLKLTPDDVLTLYNLGVIHAQQGALDEAVHYYSRAVAINPNYFAAHNNLGAAYLVLKNREIAAKHFQEALRIQPDNEAVRHTLAILTQKKDTAVAPHSYIAALFDSYADHYDAHLSDSLRYQVPGQMYDMMHHTVQLPDHQWQVLDLGCGTGLCGQYFRDTASVLTGVDLSERMLDVARAKQIYDKLVKVDVLEFLVQHKATYDLILAGDTLVYMGDLADIFAAVYQALRPSGYFIFNTEAGDVENFQMSTTGRFTHSKSYLDQLITAQQFHVLSFRSITLRMQDDQPVQGYLYLLQK